MRSDRKWRGLGLCVLLGLGVGCDRNIAPYEPGELPQEPDLRRIFPAPEPTGAPAPMGMPPSPTAGASTASTPSTPSAAAVRGEVHLSEGTTPVPGSVLFVIARRRGAQGGPPLAVMRIGDPVFPQVFELGQDQVMIPGLRFEGPLAITARLDADGNAMTRDPSDPATASGYPADPGQADILLRLETSASP
ncbi:MAG: hypothetical protein VX252_03655 [Myxococcota bacterium]|nr:hypothetical protein [Myxococcota bacterium]